MNQNILLHPALLAVALMSAATAVAAPKPAPASSAQTEAAPIPAKPEAGPSGFQWSASIGVGYDSNVYQAPETSYIDYATAGTLLVIPKKETGMYIPYEIKGEIEKDRDQDTTLRGSAALDGSLYPGSGLSNANETNIAFSGGMENVLARKGKSKDTLYAGGVIERHDQTYVDHDNGLAKTAADKYSYTTTGAEAAYRNRTGRFDFGVSGKYLINNYDTPSTGAEMDNTTAKIGADIDFPAGGGSRLNLAVAHWTQDYSRRHARDAAGDYSSAANPLLLYTYDSIGATLRSRISDEWLLYVDADLKLRNDGFVNYHDYQQNRFGVRTLYEKSKLKGRLSLHHWTRDYPNAFAFDVPAQGAKKYSGTDLKVRAEIAQTRNSSLWAELDHEIQDSTDLRYDYSRTRMMAGMGWAY